MRKFDHSFLKNSLLPASLLGITNSIAELKVLEQIRKRDFQNIFTKLESIAKVQSVKGSNAIENIVTTDKRIEEIISRCLYATKNLTSVLPLSIRKMFQNANELSKQYLTVCFR
jgi:hypothetical protein